MENKKNEIIKRHIFYFVLNLFFSELRYNILRGVSITALILRKNFLDIFRYYLFIPGFILILISLVVNLYYLNKWKYFKW